MEEKNEQKPLHLVSCEYRTCTVKRAYCLRSKSNWKWWKCILVLCFDVIGNSCGCLFGPRIFVQEIDQKIQNVSEGDGVHRLRTISEETVEYIPNTTLKRKKHIGEGSMCNCMAVKNMRWKRGGNIPEYAFCQCKCGMNRRFSWNKI